MTFSKLGCLLLLTALLVFAGCSEEDSDLFPPPPPDPMPIVDSPGQLMANFQRIYETRDIEKYRLILDPDFVTILQQDTTNDFPHVGAELDYDEELQIHDRLFSGEALTDPDGGLLPAVDRFGFSRFTQVVDWGLSLPTDPIPNTLSSLYEVEILVDRGQSFSTLKIEGQIRFYLATIEVMHDGEPKTSYRLVGQLDLTDNRKDVSIMAWGSLKAYFH